VIVEYALRNLQSPIGVSQYVLAKALPKALRGSLPTVEQLEAEFRDDRASDTPPESDEEP
jgi:hypothetical protein